MQCNDLERRLLHPLADSEKADLSAKLTELRRRRDILGNYFQTTLSAGIFEVRGRGSKCVAAVLGVDAVAPANVLAHEVLELFERDPFDVIEFLADKWRAGGHGETSLRFYLYDGHFCGVPSNSWIVNGGSLSAG